MRIFLFFVFAVFSVTTQGVRAQQLEVQIVDVGQALCTITKTPDDHFMIYDAGHWKSKQCLSAAKQIIGNNPIDLMIISHSDADHLGEAEAILNTFDVRQIMHTGMERKRTNKSGNLTTWYKFDRAVSREIQNPGVSVINLQSSSLMHGAQFALGNDAKVTFIAGWKNWEDDSDWTTPSDKLSSSEKRNAPSIVVRLDYAGKSVLFTGDTVGKSNNDNDATCEAAEKYMVDNSSAVEIKSDVMIAPHHGGNNGSATCFVKAVNPTYVVFPAGSGHGHPKKKAVARYLKNGVKEANIFLTDLGEKDSKPDKEWAGPTTRKSPSTKRGDDNVLIRITSSGQLTVKYN
ncbi:MBL fold metallo-hydrolase [Kordiimonas sp. SCSIO 12603]|uniref:ComEC/Rec2 family competence protein n=1 Tax=Kordiimonas sp. SCSIO 12603 TaxID=2829596 RepID=UPI0021033781|nr:MBL fold metallo-hydrolase [Kordiimonas sp. SCSIO 12603]UTW59522.1 MBL fold metallo-hydrolase [Kordiimonas sp. SCSIO 12603]